MSWSQTLFSQGVKVNYPLVQAPCAGHTGVGLIAAVSNAGGLGSLGAGTMAVDQLRETVREIRQATGKPFAVNLFCRPMVATTKEALQKEYATDQVLNKIREELQITIPSRFELRSPPLEEQIEVLVEEKVPVVSFTFGTLPEPAMRRLWDAGTYLIGTATTLDEALVLAGASDASRKADAILLQGLEAGGHRGSFLKSESQEGQRPLLTLVKEVKAALGERGMPLVAAGGLSTGEDVVGVLKAGADGAALGTLFMLATESTSPKAHREKMIRASAEESPELGRGWTGRWARGIPNALNRRVESSGHPIPAYDIHSSKTKDIAAHCAQQGIADYMLLLTGQNVRQASAYSQQGTLSASHLVAQLVADITRVFP
ncbi:2-nitropropane dioxygenase [Sporodiniella umbellata]|nr:2-nitropropane dioxygenase [Sporodiniella umbellata]